MVLESQHFESDLVRGAGFVHHGELKGVGLCNGLVVGTVALLVAWAWSANPSMGIAVGLAMLGTIVMASLAGSVIPMVLRGMGLDPAQASSIFLLTLTDMTGFAIFLGLASALRTLLAA